MDISFRLMKKDDLPIVSNWQMKSEVHQWYGKEYTSTEQIEKRYQKELNEFPRLTHHFIIQLDGIDAGMVQTYLLCSYPDMEKHVQTDGKSAMTDIFLAPEFMHKGYGSRIMKTFLWDFVFSEKLFVADKCYIGPEPKNISAIRMYEKAGFCYLKTIQIPDEDEPEYIMIISKEKLLKSIAINN
jgi:Acetyltransferases, including N-acetylases of ribosomal proteins